MWRRRTWMVWGALGASLLLVGGVVAACLAFSGSDGASTAPIGEVRVAVPAPGVSASELDRTLGTALAETLTARLGPTADVEVVSREGAVAVWITDAEHSAHLVQRVRAALEGISLPYAPSVVEPGPAALEVGWLFEEPAAAARDARLRARVERLEGVRVLRRCGPGEDEIVVETDAARLAAFGLDARAVMAALVRHTEEPAGRSGDGARERPVRMDARDPVARVGETALPGAAGPLELRDVADIRYAPGASTCACVGAHEPCVMGVAEVRDAAVADGVYRLVAEEGGTPLFSTHRAYVAPADPSPEALSRLARGLLGEVACADVAEVQPMIADRRVVPDLVLFRTVPSCAADAPGATPPGLQLLSAGGLPPVARVLGDDGAIEEVANALSSTVGAVEGVRAAYALGLERRAELDIRLDPDAARRYGVRAEDVARSVRLSTAGEVVARLRDGAREIDVRVQTSAVGEDLAAVTVSSADGHVVPLGEVASVSMSQVPSEIRRTVGGRVIDLYVDLGDEPSRRRELMRAVRAAVEATELPPGVAVVWR